jgi:thiol-disulfide isomerase/thioredoxin
MRRAIARAGRALVIAALAVACAAPAQANRTQTFSMKGADGADGGERVIAGLKKLKGVKKAAFDKQKVEFQVTLADGVPDRIVLEAIDAAGYQGFAGPGQGAYLPAGEYPKNADVAWVTHDGSAVGPLDRLRVSGKYTVLDVYADWCAPCRAVDARLRQLSATRADLAVRKLNVVDFDRPLAKQLGRTLTALPHVIVYAPDGHATVIHGADLKKLDAALTAR